MLIWGGSRLREGNDVGEITEVVQQDVDCESVGTGDVAGETTEIVEVKQVVGCLGLGDGDKVFSGDTSPSTEGWATIATEFSSLVLDRDSSSVSTDVLISDWASATSSSSLVRSTNESGMDALIPLVLTALSDTLCFWSTTKI